MDSRSRMSHSSLREMGFDDLREYLLMNFVSTSGMRTVEELIAAYDKVAPECASGAPHGAVPSRPPRVRLVPACDAQRSACGMQEKPCCGWVSSTVHSARQWVTEACCCLDGCA
jgi:hypothetical protein